MGKANFHEGEPTNNEAFDFGTTTQGDPQYLTGPALSSLNNIPLRGSTVVAHGVDSDVLAKDWAYDPQSHETDASTDAAGGDGGKFEEWEAPVPLLVTVLEMPVETEERYSRTINIFGASEPYTFTAPGVSNDQPRPVIGKDDTRTRTRIICALTAQGMLGVGSYSGYIFRVSHNESMAGAINIHTTSIPVIYEFLHKGTLYAQIVPLATYDNSKVNICTLSAISESAILGSHKVK